MNNAPPPDEIFVKRATGLEWLLFDVDGVLTDGRLVYTRWGEEIKVFNVRDGLALRLARQAGLKVGLFSGRKCKALEKRASELELDTWIVGSKDKAVDFEKFLAQHNTTPARVGYIGDDLQDLAVLGRCGMSFAPADAVAEVRAVVHHVLEKEGGAGVAREMVEKILKARGDWRRLTARFSLET